MIDFGDFAGNFKRRLQRQVRRGRTCHHLDNARFDHKINILIIKSKLIDRHFKGDCFLLTGLQVDPLKTDKLFNGPGYAGLNIFDVKLYHFISGPVARIGDINSDENGVTRRGGW